MNKTMALLPQSEAAAVTQLTNNPVMDATARRESEAVAAEIIRNRRRDETLVDLLMRSYALSSREGLAMMSLAEAMLRVPDAATRDALINDKIPGRHWVSAEASGLAHSAGIALSAIGVVLEREQSNTLLKVAGRLGMPIIRRAVLSAMKLLGSQFVLAETIDAALDRARANSGVLYSFDMLGEGARDEDAAARYFSAYEQAIRGAAKLATHDNVHANHGVSVKLSALYPRYQTSQRTAVLRHLLPRIMQLADIAAVGNIPLTLDAEEMARLDLSLDVAAALTAADSLRSWNGLGVVVQAYGLYAGEVINNIIALAQNSRRTVAVRLVKGAYWDGEIKTAQIKGLAEFPVFTRKQHTDLAYLRHAHTLLNAAPAVFPQFASHNAATLAAVQVMARDGGGDFEVQRLHGMGASIHREFHRKFNRRQRIYAPVGGHDELLAYLVRRLLENGANSSFIHQLGEEESEIKRLVRHPHDVVVADEDATPAIRTGGRLFLGYRANSRGCDLDDLKVLKALAGEREQFKDKQYCEPGSVVNINPARPDDRLFTPAAADAAAVAQAFAAARATAWQSADSANRATVLSGIAAVYERHRGEILALLAREAGKTLDDAVDELREAVDFCHYYAAQLLALPQPSQPRGVVLAISPWNFPLAIFTGQIVAALAAGNAVVAKPAEQTPLIALLAVKLMKQAGVPDDALHLLFGKGETLGARLTAAGLADMVVFTGATDTARRIQRAIAASSRPAAPLLAETGGINAMVVDSTALLERVVDDIVTSAFRSAGQRCSALRVLYAQNDIADKLLAMIKGASACLRIGDPWNTDTDIGPVINREAKQDIEAYVASQSGRVCWRVTASPSVAGCVAPTLVLAPSIADIKREVFGPVLHVVAYAADRLDEVLCEINNSGYGLTFGLHSRIENRQHGIAAAVGAGNVYINRNQIGAVVASQPFGGCGLSGTGPKAGGPLYLGAFTRNIAPVGTAARQELMPGPDGEENRYSQSGRGLVLLLTRSLQEAALMRDVAVRAGNSVRQVDDIPDDLFGVEAVMAGADVNAADIESARRRLADWQGAIIPLITDAGGHAWLVREKHVSIDTTALGGNVSLLSMEAASFAKIQV